MQLLPRERKMRQIYREGGKLGAKAEIYLVQRKDVLEKCSYLNSFLFDTPASGLFLFDFEWQTF